MAFVDRKSIFNCMITGRIICIFMAVGRTYTVCSCSYKISMVMRCEIYAVKYSSW